MNVFNQVRIDSELVNENNQLSQNELITMISDFDFMDCNTTYHMLDHEGEVKEKLKKLLSIYRKDKNLNFKVRSEGDFNIKKKKNLDFLRSIKPLNFQNEFSTNKSTSKLLTDQTKIIRKNKRLRNNNSLNDETLKNFYHRIMKNQIDQIINPELIEEYQKEKQEYHKNEEKKEKLLKKYITVKNSKYLVKISNTNSNEKLANKESLKTIENDERNSFKKYITDDLFSKYMEKFQAKSKDQKVFENLTKYLKNTYNIKAPKYKELLNLEKLIDTVGNQKKISQNLDQKLLIPNLNYRKIYAKKHSSCNFVEENNSKPKIELITPRIIHNNSVSQLKIRHSSIETKNNQTGTLIVGKCASYIKKNMNMIKKNFIKNDKIDSKIKESFKKVFSQKDYYLEKELGKESIKILKNQGEFIYGAQSGYFSSNRSRILDILKKN